MVAALLALFAGTLLFKFTGPVLLGGRDLPDRVQRIAAVLPAPLLAALVVVQTMSTADGMGVDARLLGVVAGGVAVLLRAPFLVVVVVAAVVTAAVRALS